MTTGNARVDELVDAMVSGDPYVAPPLVDRERSWAKYLEGAYRRTLDQERDLLLFIDEIAKAVDLHGDGVTFEQVLENVKGLRAAYGDMCDRLRECAERHGLGLGGEHVDALVIEALDQSRSSHTLRS